eukprot:scaffold25017_cov142-Cylindrotheca_fusiformis.AAC.1
MKESIGTTVRGPKSCPLLNNKVCKASGTMVLVQRTLWIPAKFPKFAFKDVFTFGSNSIFACTHTFITTNINIPTTRWRIVILLAPQTKRRDCPQ